MSDFIHAIAAAPISVYLREVPWIIPAIQTVHILAIAILVGSLLMVVTQAVRPHPNRSLSLVAGQFFPWLFGAGLVLLASGSVLILAEPARTLANTTFWIKMGLLAVMLPCLLALRRRGVSEAAGLPRAYAGTGWQRAFLPASAATLVVAIIFAGRWIAYTEPLIQ